MTQKENNKSSACQRFATKVQDSSAHGPRIWTEGKGQTAIMATDCNPKIELKGSGWNYQADSYFFFFLHTTKISVKISYQQDLTCFINPS